MQQHRAIFEIDWLMFHSEIGSMLPGYRGRARGGHARLRALNFKGYQEGTASINGTEDRLSQFSP
jgi:hypothetical protein